MTEKTDLTMPGGEGGSFFRKLDWSAFWTACIVSFLVYFYTLAPTVTLEIANCGSIPVVISWSTVVTSSSPPEMVHFVQIVDWKAYDETGASIGSGSSQSSLESLFTDYQLDPCQRIKLELTKHIQQDDPPYGECPMNASVTYVHTVTATQWNKA